MTSKLKTGVGIKRRVFADIFDHPSYPKGDLVVQKDVIADPSGTVLSIIKKGKHESVLCIEGSVPHLSKDIISLGI